MKKILILLMLIINLISYSQNINEIGNYNSRNAGNQIKDSSNVLRHEFYSNEFYSNYPFYSNFGYKNDSIKKVLFLGDSRFTDVYLSYIDCVSKNGYNNGLGFIRFKGNGTTNSTVYTMYEANITYNSSPTTPEEFGVSGSSVILNSNTDSISYTNTDMSGDDNVFYYFSNFDIIYLKSATYNGKFKYRVDGGTWDTVNCSGSNSLGVEHVDITIIRNHANHLIEIEGATDSCRLYGIRTYRSEPLYGMISDFINVGGSWSTKWVNNIKYVKELIDYFNYDEIHFWLGANDYTNSITTADFIASIDTICDTIHSVGKSWSNIVLYTNYDYGTIADSCVSNSAANTVLEAYDNSMIDYAYTNGLSIFRVDKIIPNRSIGCSLGIWKDYVHLNATGGQYLANYIFKISSLDAVNYKNLALTQFDGQIYVNSTKGIVLTTLSTTGVREDNHKIWGSGTSKERIAFDAGNDDVDEIYLYETYMANYVGEANIPSSNNTITAAGGVTTAMLGDVVIKVYGSGGTAIDITKNPQIPNGLITGQHIILLGTSDAGTVQFDNGDGLILKSASVVLGLNDMLELYYISGQGWVENGHD